MRVLNTCMNVVAVEKRVLPVHSRGSFSTDSWAAAFRVGSLEKMLPFGPGVAGSFGSKDLSMSSGHSLMNCSRMGSPASSCTLVKRREERRDRQSNAMIEREREREGGRKENSHESRTHGNDPIESLQSGLIHEVRGVQNHLASHALALQHKGQGRVLGSAESGKPSQLLRQNF